MTIADEIKQDLIIYVIKGSPHLHILDRVSKDEYHIKGPERHYEILQMKKIPVFDFELRPFYIVKSTKAIMVANVIKATMIIQINCSYVLDSK